MLRETPTLFSKAYEKLPLKIKIFFSSKKRRIFYSREYEFYIRDLLIRHRLGIAYNNIHAFHTEGGLFTTWTTPRAVPITFENLKYFLFEDYESFLVNLDSVKHMDFLIESITKKHSN